jgi:hypothetical protein
LVQLLRTRTFGEEADPALANRQYGEPPEPPLKHLFDDEDLDFSDEEDAESIAKLYLGRRRTGCYGFRSDALYPEERETARRERARSAQTTKPINLFGVEDDFDEDEEEVRPKKHSQTTRTKISRTGSSTTRVFISTKPKKPFACMRRRKKRARAKPPVNTRNTLKKQLRKKRKHGHVCQDLWQSGDCVAMLVAVGVALYFGFLLSDIVVMGNDAFSTDYISFSNPV